MQFSNKTFNEISLPPEKHKLSEIISKAKDWALTHGIVIRQNFDTEFIKFVPFILLPSPFPRSEFKRAISKQKILNELLHNVSYDYDFLKDSFKDTIKRDEFIRNLFEIYEIIQNEGASQDISLGIFRSDYLIDINSINSQIKQVETNTISAGFATMGQKAYKLHKYVLTELGYHEKIQNLPQNNALTETTLGLLKAWEIYNNKKSGILFVINKSSLNTIDVRYHEYEIQALNEDLKVICRTLTQIAETAKLGSNKQLLIDGFEIAVVYYRTGFKPEHYNSKIEWNARLLMERSLAIKCPSIQYQLAGTKKIQQVLTQTNILEKFLKSPETIKSLKETFTGLYSLDFDEYGEQAVKMALEDPEKFVLKSERDGGGNNIFGEDIRNFLINIKDNVDRTAWILMDKIFSPISQGYMIRYDKIQHSDLVSELGIFGVILGSSNKIFYNKQAGHLLRTKLSTNNEGGCLHGNGGIDSPYLFD